MRKSEIFKNPNVLPVQNYFAPLDCNEPSYTKSILHHTNTNVCNDFLMFLRPVQNRCKIGAKLILHPGAKPRCKIPPLKRGVLFCSGVDCTGAAKSSFAPAAGEVRICKHCGKELLQKQSKVCSKNCAAMVAAQSVKGLVQLSPKLDMPKIVAEYRSGKTLKEIAATVRSTRQNIAKELKMIGVYDFNRIRPQRQKRIAKPEDLIVAEYRREEKKLRKLDNLWASYHPAVLCWMNHWADKTKSAAIARKRWQSLRLNPLFRIKSALRHRLWAFTKSKGVLRSGSAIDLLGCDWHTFSRHFESRFTDGMDWSNYGKWEIDHIKPCSLFDLTKPEEQRACFHYKNLQPLWKSDNASKGGINRMRGIQADIKELGGFRKPSTSKVL